MIAAVARNGVIGRDNDLPWRISEDLQYFKRMTLGKPIIMGRKNYESIGRPLPGRRNIILTRDSAYRADGCEIYYSPDELMAAFGKEPEIMICGGGQIYKMFLPEATTLYLTEIDADIDGDVFFPEFDRLQWQLESSEKHTSKEGWSYAFNVYRRR